MKKSLLCSFLLLLLPNLNAETLHWGSSGQKPLEVVLSAIQPELPDGYSEGNQVTTITQTKVACTNNTTNCLPQTQVTFTVDGLEDDSIKAIRYTMLLEQAQNQPWRIIQNKESYLCRKGRGQQKKFSDKKCL